MALPKSGGDSVFKVIHRRADGSTRLIAVVYVNGEYRHDFYDQKEGLYESFLYHRIADAEAQEACVADTVNLSLCPAFDPAKYSQGEKAVEDRALKEHLVYNSSISTFASGTRLLISATRYRPNGSLEQVKERQQDGTYVVRQLAENGSSLRVLQVFAADQRLLNEMIWRTDGSLSSLQFLTGNVLVKTLFSEAGRRVSHLSEIVGSSKTTVFYDGSGEKVMSKVVHTHTATTVTYYDHRGAVVQEREFWSDRLFITVYGAAEARLYKQRWLRNGGDDNNPRFKFDGIIILSDKGEIKRTIDFHPDGLTPSKIVAVDKPNRYNSSMRTESTYDTKGRLVSALRRKGEYGSSTQLSAKVAAARADTKIPRIKRAWLTMPQPHVWPERPTPPLSQSDLDF